MSYICMLVNSRGAAAAGDSRETFDLGMHLSLRRKVFVSDDGRSIWAMCGLTRCLGVDYFRRASAILRSGGSHSQQLVRVGKLLSSGTRIQSKLSRAVSSFTLMACFADNDSPKVYVLRAVNGRCSIEQRAYPICLEAGSGTQNIPALKVPDLDSLSLAGLERTARLRTQEAIEGDRAAHEKNWKHRVTVGGRIITETVRFKGGK